MKTLRHESFPFLIQQSSIFQFRPGAILKRAFDVLASALGLLLLSPVFAMIAVAIKRDSPGPVFYRGPRAGRDGRNFGILKFRTMYERPESYRGALVTAHGDDRITALGHWLRDTKLNELPQLWNVLVGEMSLVGPRPEDPDIAQSWPHDAREEILSVRPGITSPASVIYRDEEKLLNADNVMDSYLKDVLPAKLRLDRLYVRNNGFLADLDVIFYTLVSLLPRLQKDTISMETLFHGMFARFARRYISWFAIDSLAAFAAVSLTVLARRLTGPLDLGVNVAVTMAVLMALVFSLVNSALGLGRIAWRYAKPAYAFDLAFSSAVTTLLLLTADLLWPRGPFFPPDTILAAGIVAFFGFFGVRYRGRILTGIASRWIDIRGLAHGIGERVLIVGAGDCGLLATWLLHHSKLSSAFTVVGMVDDDPVKQGMRIDGHFVHGLTRRIPDLVRDHDVGVILFAIEQIQPSEQARILQLCRQTRARVVLVPDLLAMFRERITSGVSVPALDSF